MSHSVTWFQIQGQDPAALHKFYGEVFAWKMAAMPDGSMRVLKEKGGIDGGIGASPSGASNVSVYVTCDDIDAQLAKIEAAGGKAALSKTELPDGMGYIAGFTDPAGNFVGLWASSKPAPAKRSVPEKPSKKAGKAQKANKKVDKKKSDKADKKAKKADKKSKKADKKAKKSP